jgi:hypothetical protein
LVKLLKSSIRIIRGIAGQKGQPVGIMVHIAEANCE